MLIADDHRLFAEALEAILSAEERIDVVGHARDGREAVELWQERRPDLTLMDIAMPVLDGIAATREIRKLDDTACILMLTGSNARADVDHARQAGAAGYVTKDRIAAELIDAIIEVAGPLTPATMAARMVGFFAAIHVLISFALIGARADALGSRRRDGRHGLHAAVPGRDAHRRAEPHPPDGGRVAALRDEHDRALAPALLVLEAGPRLPTRRR